MSDDEDDFDEPTTTLADDFLADLDELDSGEEEADDDDEAMDDADEAVGALAQNVKSIAHLRTSEDFMRIMAAIKMYTHENAAQEREIVGPLEEDPEYQLIVETNELSTEIDNEIMLIHKFIRDIYAKKFPELENLIQNPVDYAKVVKGIGNEMDLTMVNLDELMPSSTVMVVSVTGSTTNGKPLSDEDLQSCLEGCDEMLALFDDRMDMLGYVESRMEKFAPNVSALIGAHLSARMIGDATRASGTGFCRESVRIVRCVHANLELQGLRED
jgi:U4/U6 small nuclear ribonucleoprotein PRP31